MRTIVPDFAESVFQVVDIGSRLAGNNLADGTAVGIVAQGDVAVGSERVGVVILPGTGEIGVADPDASRVGDSASE